MACAPSRSPTGSDIPAQARGNCQSRVPLPAAQPGAEAAARRGARVSGPGDHAVVGRGGGAAGRGEGCSPCVVPHLQRPGTTHFTAFWPDGCVTQPLIMGGGRGCIWARSVADFDSEGIWL